MNKNILLAVGLIVALLVTGFVVYSVVRKLPSAPTKTTQNNEPDQSAIDDSLPQNTSIEVAVEKSTAKDNTINIHVTKLESKYTGIAYEVTYETKGTYQGVNSGSKPLDVNGKSEFIKEIYLGTCSKNVCTPHTGVTKVSVALELTDSDGKKTQFSKDFPL